MSFKGKFRKIIYKRYDLIVGVFLFLSYRIFFTYLLWHGRFVPPEPDDSYYYLASARHIFDISTFEKFRLLPFSLWLSFLSTLFHSNLELAYKINFYIGPVVMFTAAYYFVSKLESNRVIRLLLLAVLALYSGSGDYHGFFWVVESFYQFALFLVIFAFMINKNHVKLYIIFPVCLFFIFIHPTSAFLSVIFALYPITLSLFSKKDAVKSFYNIISIFICLGISFFLYLAIGKLFPIGNSPQSLHTQFSLIKDFFLGKLNPISLPVIWREYFSIFFNNTITTVAYFAMLIFVIYLKKYKLIAIYLSILIIVLLSTYIPYGARTLGLLWPVTFFIIAYFLVGIWKALQSIESKIKLGYLTIIPLACLFTFVTIFNVISVSTMNTTKNYSWDRTCPLRLQDKNIYFTSQESLNAFLLYGGKEKNLHFLSITEAGDFLKEDNMLVETKNEKLQPRTLSRVEKFLASRLTRRNTSISIKYPVNAWTEAPIESTVLLKDLSLNNMQISKYLDCGHFQVSIVSKL